MPYVNEHSARIKDPKGFDSFDRKNDEFSPGIHIIYGIKDDKSEVQAIRFDAKKFTEEEAREWLEVNNYEPIEFEAAVEVENSFFNIQNEFEDTIDILLTGEIGIDISGKNIIDTINNIKNKKIKMHIFSPGGLLFDALAIYDYIKANNINIEIDIHGLSGSAATIISCASKYVRIGKNSYYYIHNVKNATNKQSYKKYTDTIIKIYQEKTKLDKEKIIKLLNAGESGSILSAQEAFNYNFVNEIIQEKNLSLNTKGLFFNNHSAAASGDVYCMTQSDWISVEDFFSKSNKFKKVEEILMEEVKRV